MVEVKYGGFGKRLIAMIADSIFLMVPMGILDRGLILLPPVIYDGLSIAILGLIISYWIVLPVKMGGTLGKRLMGLRIVNLNGSNINYIQSLIRYSPFLIFAIASTFAPIFNLLMPILIVAIIQLIYYIADFIAFLVSEKNQTLRDLMAKSYVIFEDEKVIE